ncbi:hypothetical protein EYF80_023139 [Liparis tanakae]|uniref:Uncharacterized protein n=1 Tax=Liparis tanakae TaxID=230148 RepID=A0A4Z2HMU0_9TELE|nr:hypothetical protein EYF80_023139 [Liparis tanakae]
MPTLSASRAADPCGAAFSRVDATSWDAGSPVFCLSAEDSSRGSERNGKDLLGLIKLDRERTDCSSVPNETLLR